MLMKLDSDSTPAMTNVAVVSTASRSLKRSPSISASARWVIRSSVGLARRAATSAVRKSLGSWKAAMCSAVRPFVGLSVETAKMTFRLISAWSRSGRPMVRKSRPTVMLAALAPIAGILLGQDFVVRKGIGIDCRRIQIERFHHVAGNPAYFGSGRGYHGGCDQSLDRLFRRPITMSKASTTLSGEERLIARYFKPLAKHPGAFGLADDAAVITPPAGCDLVLKTDGIVAGVHFFPDDPAETVGKKALRANLSDLAAKGARPLGFLLTLALPHDIGDAWLAPFARGL